MLAHTKRTLRNGSTCPTVPNPLSSKQTAEQLQEFLPGTVKVSLENAQSLSCNQVNNLPTLSLPRSAEEALRIMQSATQWQSLSVKCNLNNHQQPQQIQKPSQHQVQNPAQLDVIKKEMKAQPQNSIYSVLFQNQLHDFIMNPPPVNYDFEYLYHHPIHNKHEQHNNNAYFDH